LEDDYWLKIFCGFQNDLARLKKDWSCFVEGVLDIQLMWFTWKARNAIECENVSWNAIKKQLIERG